MHADMADNDCALAILVMLKQEPMHRLQVVRSIACVRTFKNRQSTFALDIMLYFVTFETFPGGWLKILF